MSRAWSCFQVVNSAFLRSPSVQFAYLTNMNRLTSSFLRACFVLALLVFPNLSKSQDVMNGGFESVSSLPNTTGQWTLADYLGATLLSTGGVIPMCITWKEAVEVTCLKRPVAIISPLQGMAVAGFIACGEEGTNRREYLTGQFSDAVDCGQTGIK